MSSPKYTIQVLQAYLSKTEVPPDELPALIQQVHRSIKGLDGVEVADVSGAPVVEETPVGEAPAEEKKSRRPLKPEPVVPVEEAFNETSVVCLACGKRMKSLKRHIKTAHKMDVATYRSQYNLPEDVPIVAPSFSKQRREAAQTIGLGKKRKGKGRGPAKKK
ncbi:MAG: MucR family transcriptional regulator [Magnetococcales bacterium]|nr:MucR family transcriptional regulator [Magnetococcales bacterium]